MKLLVWGTGLLAERFMATVKGDVIGREVFFCIYRR